MNDLTKNPWETMGHGKHDYRHIDPATINVEDYAKDLRGEEEHFGDIREYNSAFNQKHPGNNTTLDDLARVGTTIETDALMFEGTWMVVQMPVVVAPATYARLARIGENGEPIEGTQEQISCIDLGCAVDETNNFKQVETKLLHRGKVGREQRERLTKLQKM